MNVVGLKKIEKKKGLKFVVVKIIIIIIHERRFNGENYGVMTFVI